MTILLIFLLACAVIYLGVIESAFSALMRLSLRLLAERSGRPDALGEYLEDPIKLFVPVRLLLSLAIAAATGTIISVVRLSVAPRLTVVILTVVAFVILTQVIFPLLIARRDPERILGLLLPTFRPIARLLEPLSAWTAKSITAARRAAAPPPDEADGTAGEVAKAYIETAEQEGIIEGEERRLLQSIVDFGDTLVREVMTPRPDIVALPEKASIGELRALFREQEYSRFPVYNGSLDNISGFVFVKDLVAVDVRDELPITGLLRPAAVVPESKRVPELLKQFQRQQTQIAIVVDEYGGTAGLVTIEDLLEEIVGEIRDEYDVESEPIVEEAEGRFVFHGKVDIDEVSQRLNVDIEREGFETIGGYIISKLGRVPAVGEHFDADGLAIEILDVQRRRIHKARISRRVEVDVAPDVGEKTV